MEMYPRVHGKALVCALFLCMLTTPSLTTAVEPPPQGKTAVFFSQGQSIYHPQDRARSRQEAVQDFLLQGVTQALGSFLSPSQMGSQFGLIQDKVLRQPDRYVVHHQIFSESPAGGLYRVTGQVTVAMDSLKKDVVQMGLGSPEPGQRPGGAAPSGGLSRSEAESASTGSLRDSGPQATRGITPSRRELYWAVAESWDQGWSVPRGTRDPRGIFAASILQESQDYPWTVRLPESGALTPDEGGNISIHPVLAQAKGLGIEKAVVGTVALRKSPNQNPRIETVLRVLDVPSGKLQGEIRKQRSLRGGSTQESVLELASLIMPQLDQFMGEGGRRAAPADRRFLEPQSVPPAAVAPPTRPEPPELPPAMTPPVRREVPEETPAMIPSVRSEPIESPSKPAAAGPSPAPLQPPPAIRGTGEVTLSLRNLGHFAQWEELEKHIREKAKSARVTGVTMGPESAQVRLEGVDGQFLESLSGTRLKGGLTVQVEGYAPDTRTVTISFGHSE